MRLMNEGREEGSNLGYDPSSNDAEKHISYSDYLENNDAGYKGYIFNLVEPYLQNFYDTCLYKVKGITDMWCQRYKERLSCTP